MRTVGLFLLAGVCMAQQPTFDAASVKLADPTVPPGSQNTGGPGSTDPGRIHYARILMLQLLTQAYGVDIDQISGPAWISDFMGKNFYQIDATMPGNTTKGQFQWMLQNLLAERFHLQVHRATRSFPGYDLLVAKDGPKLKAVPPDPNEPTEPAKPTLRDGKMVWSPGPRMMNNVGPGRTRVEAHEQPISKLIQYLSSGIPSALGADTMDFSVPRARVVDKTGLTGKYDFTLEYACLGCKGLAGMAASLPLLDGRAQSDSAPAPAAADPGSGLPTIFVALEKQLGLKLEKAKAVPLDVIVVDRVDKVPTGN
jgi:uncharacterized protein (TIGR03435 family)